MKFFRVKNNNGNIEVCIFKKANAVFQTNEYNETEDACIYRETINIFELVSNYKQLQQENKHLDKVNCKLRKTNEQLKDNWNKLKEWASDFYNSEEVGWAGCGMRYTLEKILELEQGSDSNE